MTGPIVPPTPLPVPPAPVPPTAISAGAITASVQFDGAQLLSHTQRWSVLHDLSLDGGATWATEWDPAVPGSPYGQFPAGSEFYGGRTEKDGVTPLAVYLHATPLPTSVDLSNAVQRAAVAVQGFVPVPTTVSLVSHAAVTGAVL